MRVRPHSRTRIDTTIMNKSTKPNQHITAVITFISLVPLVYFIPDFVGQYLPDNKLLNVVVVVGIIVPIISYMVMPIYLKILSKK